ncbi:MAG: endolytic transglycosylase MltG [Woeseiaceae bacterium]|nr:endolytic transglycosylase MltG [Woeseiaceae bacterium]
MKHLLLVIAILLAVLLTGILVGSVQFNRFLDTPVNVPEGGVEFVIEPGSSFGKVSQQLADRGIIDKPQWFRRYGGWTGEANAVQAGDYLIRPGTTPTELLKQFASGNVQLYSFTIIEGWNYREMLNAMREHPEINAVLEEDDWPSFLAQLGADSDYPEGLFLPETYRFPRNTTDKTLLGQAHELMVETLDEEWANRADDLPLESPYEALILASIVEKETGRADERARIAGVFVRRLQKRMRLQTDPTVIYGIGPDFDGNITRRDLRTDTPYNTYTRGGLPPTPIAMPGRAAINASLNPEDGDELFFVATGDGDGGHTFSATREEHDAAVAEYLRRLRQNRANGN